MNDTPPRKFWQIHLSTAIVVTFVSSVLLAANVKQGTFALTTERGGLGYGWPWPFFFYPRLDGWPLFQKMDNPYGDAIINVPSLLMDLSLAGLILLSIVRLLEWQIRRYESRNPG